MWNIYITIYISGWYNLCNCLVLHLWLTSPPFSSMGDMCQVDTSSFRQAIWYYIHCMYGIRHDDYDYSEVNQLLERNLKPYIKTLTCYPERVTKQEYDGVMREFKPSEKVGSQATHLVISQSTHFNCVNFVYIFTTIDILVQHCDWLTERAIENWYNNY